jgi:hypothetical protein
MNEIKSNEAESAFGIWQGQNGDGLEFQTTLREEWQRRERRCSIPASRLTTPTAFKPPRTH